jgi:hypothetical protein
LDEPWQGRTIILGRTKAGDICVSRAGQCRFCWRPNALPLVVATGRETRGKTAATSAAGWTHADGRRHRGPRARPAGWRTIARRGHARRSAAGAPAARCRVIRRAKAGSGRFAKNHHRRAAHSFARVRCLCGHGPLKRDPFKWTREQRSKGLACFYRKTEFRAPGSRRKGSRLR